MYLKGQCAVYEVVQVLEVHVIFLGPKKITRFIVDVTNAREKGMPLGRPAVGRTIYVRIKLRQETHVSWVERKRALGVRSDDELVCRLLATLTNASRNSTGTIGVTQRCNSTENVDASEMP